MSVFVTKRPQAVSSRVYPLVSFGFGTRLGRAIKKGPRSSHRVCGGFVLMLVVQRQIEGGHEVEVVSELRDESVQHVIGIEAAQSSSKIRRSDAERRPLSVARS